MEPELQEIPSPELAEIRLLRERIKRPLAELPPVRHPLPEAVNPLTILPRPLLALTGLVLVMLLLIYAAANAPGAVNFAWGQIAVLCWTPVVIGGGMALASAWRYFLFNQRLKRLARQPAHTRGLVFQLWKEGPAREVPCVLYGFMVTAPDGSEQQINIGETVTAEQFRTLAVNQPVDVAYLPDAPKMCRILYN